MLSARDHEARCRVGPGTVMGGPLRRFWMPVLITDQQVQRLLETVVP